MKLSDGDPYRKATTFLARAWKPRPLAPPLTVPQLYAIARRVYEPLIDDGEWSARIKDAVAKDGAEAAAPHEISAAIATMSNVLHRPDPILISIGAAARRPRRSPHDDSGAYLSRADAKRLLDDIEQRAAQALGGSNASHQPEATESHARR